jgi:hypothetical protein
MMEGGLQHLSQQIMRSLVVSFGDGSRQVISLSGNFPQFGLRNAGKGSSLRLG